MLGVSRLTHRNHLPHAGYRLLNLVAPLILAPLLGVPPGMYRLHHCIMHHSGNNRWSLDASSTERYQRDNPLHFLMCVPEVLYKRCTPSAGRHTQLASPQPACPHLALRGWGPGPSGPQKDMLVSPASHHPPCRYWARFALGSWFELPWVAARAGRWGVLAACLACETGYLAGVRWALRASPVAALWTLALPFAVSSLALMLGNWSQHLFLEPAAPRGSLGLAYNCVACADNQRTYNDGYHAVHHLNSKARSLACNWA